VTVAGVDGATAGGWGETPLSATWVWPSSLSFAERLEALKEFCVRLVAAWAAFDCPGHPMTIGHAFLEQELPRLLEDFNGERRGRERMAYLGGLVCCSTFDVALHDAYGMLHGAPVYATYNAQYMNDDLAGYPEPAEDAAVTFDGLYPEDFFVREIASRLPAWHLVGGTDLLDECELTGAEPADGYPVLLADWIRRDGLKCLKVKLRGTDSAWDYDRLVKVGRIALDSGADRLTSDFNCTVTEPAYVNGILDQLLVEHPRIYGMI